MYLASSKWLPNILIFLILLNYNCKFSIPYKFEIFLNKLSPNSETNEPLTSYYPNTIISFFNCF